MTDLFTGTTQTDGIQIDTTKDYFVELVGEDKKFKTSQDLARSKVEADAFITRLQAENAGMRQELNTKQTLEEYVDKMTATKEAAPVSRTLEQQATEQGGNSATLTADKLDEMIDQRVNAREKDRIHTQNLQTVKQTLQETYGNDYVNKLKETATSLGMSEDYLNQMAKETPKALLKLVGVSATDSTQSRSNQAGLFTPPASVNGFAPNTGNAQDFSYYEKLRKTSPKEYWTPTVQNEMHKNAARLGEKFYSS